MRSAILGLTLFVTACAVTGVIWLTNYRSLPLQTSSANLTIAEEELGPKVSPSGPYPKVEVSEREYNFGAMVLGSEGTHKFVLKNVGDAPLEVVARESDTSCQCTLGKLSDDGAIPPGGTVDVELKWEIKSPNPEFRHWAILRTNDPAERKLELVIRGRVEHPYVLSPNDVWDLGTIVDDQPTIVRGTITSPIHDSFKIERVETQNEQAKLAWEPLSEERLKELKAKSGYELTVNVSPELPVGSVSMSMGLHLDPPLTAAKDPFRLSLHGVHPGPIEVLGQGWAAKSNAVMLGEFSASEGKTQKLSLFVRDLPEDLKLLEVKPATDTVKVQLQKDAPLNDHVTRYFLTIEVPPGAPVNRKRTQAEKLELHFNHPKAQQMDILVDYLSL